MQLSNAPIQDAIAAQGGMATQRWLKWFISICTILQSISPSFSGTVTLNPSVTSTVVNDANVLVGSKVLLFPTSPDGALEGASGNLYISATANGNFTITHSNAPSTNRTFNYLVG